ncbi:MAG TPA: IS1595 family transposase [Methylophilaceae bacterium]|jgi:transposase-like protein
MSDSILSQPYFHSEEAAYAFVESRIWRKGPICPHCACVDRIGKMGGKSTRIGTYKCYNCRKPFTVKVGTIFESSHIPMRLWLQAIFLIASSKKGISSNQLHRTLGITLKSAWFMSHRIREAMRDGKMSPFGSSGGDVEVDETFIGHHVNKQKRGVHYMNKVLSLVDRTTGQSRSMVIDDLNLYTILPILKANIHWEARLLTDEAGHYKRIPEHFMGHGFTNHRRGEYVSRVDSTIHTNTIEGFFSIFKRGMKGVYQHCGHNHLNRYLAEYDFRYSNRAKLGIDDATRVEKLLRGVVGKRLTYETTH